MMISRCIFLCILSAILLYHSDSFCDELDHAPLDSCDALIEANIVLSAEETAILDRFFEALMMDSEGGYVLYGKKPVCWVGFNITGAFSQEYDTHRDSVIIQEGAQIWKKICQNKMHDVIIHIADQPDAKNSEHIDVLCINKKLFLQTVQENLILFQYVLGPNVTPENLLEKLTAPDQTLISVLKNDRVLIGTLLGFGVKNALCVSRIENLQEAYLSAEEQIPIKNKCHALQNFLGIYRDFFLLCREKKINREIFQPRFGYSSLDEELRDLISKLEVSSSKLTKMRPRFVFGKIRDDKETNLLIQDLESTQDKIVCLSSSENPLECYLKMIFPNQNIVTNRTLPIQPLAFTQEKVSYLPKVLGKNIWTQIFDENETYINSFYQGMRDAQEGKKQSITQTGSDYNKLKALNIAKANLEEAEHLFSELATDKSFVAAAEGKVYYRTLKQGSGKQLSKEQQIDIHCKAQTPQGRLLNDTWKDGSTMRVDLQDAIPGFPHSLCGMHEGEVREIFIHPSVGYGIYTTLDKCIYLKLEVELVSIADSAENVSLSPLEPIDFTPAFASLNRRDLEQVSNNEGYLAGYDIWKHYKKCPLYSLDAVISSMKKLQMHPKENAIFLSNTDQNLLNRLHWNIYQVSNLEQYKLSVSPKPSTVSHSK